jgi:glycosyltransferase involved in cell wall biosynthesis
MKKTILHFIYDLGRGGAETMLVRVLKELKAYHNIVVTLYDNNHFRGELECDELINLNHPHLLAFRSTAKKLRHIIESKNVDLVHTHLFWPTVIARLGVPEQIPLVTTIHAFVQSSLEYKLWWVRLLDKYSFKKRPSIIVAVSKGALKEYMDFHRQPVAAGFVLYTFVDLEKFSRQKTSARKGETLKIVSVGALRKQKNQALLVDAMSRLKDQPIELDIYGSGPLEDELKNKIASTGANLKLKGESNDLQNILPEYDLFIMSSLFEGFSLSVLEAMAIGLPLLLSDIPSFREQCEETAVYFPLNSAGLLAEKIKNVVLEYEAYGQRAEMAKQRVRDHFSLAHHVEGLKSIYAAQLKQ